MDGSTMTALVFIGFVVFGPIILVFLEYVLDPIADRIIDYIDSRNGKGNES